MRSKRDVVRLITALARLNDSDVLSGDEGLPAEVCAPEDRATIREIRALLLPIRQSADYAQSPEFRGMVAGKSPDYQAMQEKLVADPVKRLAYTQRLDKALAELLDSDEAFRLLAEVQHTTLTAIRQHLQRLRNPD